MAQRQVTYRSDYQGNFESRGTQVIGSTFTADGGNVIFNAETATNFGSECLRAFLATDPRVERRQILSRKGDIQKDSCSWVLQDPAFIQWWNQDAFRMLWIHGDPGKGKTMMAMTLIDEIAHRIQQEEQERPTETRAILTYFFCQAEISGLNDGISVLRGLIYLLVEQRRDLLHYVVERYATEGSRLFEGDYGMHALWDLLSEILQDPLLPRIYLVVDALDECGLYQMHLLQLLTSSGNNLSPKVKWLVTSRNEPQIKQTLDDSTAMLHTSLELNSNHIAVAVQSFIESQVMRLQKKKNYDDEMRMEVKMHLLENAQDTFLWVALVCQQLARPATTTRKTLSTLRSFPAGLEALYQRMLEQIRRMADKDDVKLCRQILCAATLSYQPLHTADFPYAAELSADFRGREDYVQELIELCGSFLTVREGVVYFVHQSAREYLCGKGSEWLFPRGQQSEQKEMARRLFKQMKETLKMDICGLVRPGTLNGEVTEEILRQSIPSHIRYACRYWVDHLVCKSLASSIGQDTVILEKSDYLSANEFLSIHLLHWIEALSLLRILSDGISSLVDLEARCQDGPSSGLRDFLHDARRFLLYHRTVLERAPLQVYSSALLFSPTNAATTQAFSDQLPKWVRLAGPNSAKWTACLQTLEGHSASVTTAAFSSDGLILASGSTDKTARLWDTKTGAARHILQGHSDCVNVVVLSHDGLLVATGSEDKTIRLWDTRTGTLRRILKGHLRSVKAVVFSCDSSLVASGSYDRTVRLWDTVTGTTQAVFEAHFGPVTSVVFLGDGPLIASGSYDKTIGLWDVAAKKLRKVLHGHSDSVTIVVCSSTGSLIASGSDDGTVRLWDTKTGVVRKVLEGHSFSVTAVVFSPDASLVASVSGDKFVRVWDTKTGEIQTLQGHSARVTTVQFSPNQLMVISGSRDRTIRVWDAKTGTVYGVLEGHSQAVNKVEISRSGSMLASGSWDKTIRLWDMKAMSIQDSVNGHSAAITTVAFSYDGSTIATASGDKSIRLWDAISGMAGLVIKGHFARIKTILFSPNGSLLASGFEDKTVRLFDTTLGVTRELIQDHYNDDSIIEFKLDESFAISEPREGQTRS